MAEQAGPLWALGAMSGTSLDGVDAAMVLTDGVVIHDFGPHAYRPYSAAEQAVLHSGRGLWQGDAGVEDVAQVVEAAHIALLSRFTGAEVVGFHGQTLAHEPANGRTHQAGDGARLAAALGVKTVWDFRSNDVALGGQGAPLVPFFHHACAVWAGLRAPVAFLNLGGVGNVTWVDPRVAAPEQAGAVLAFDTGPANAPINDLMRVRRGAARDDGGALALSGQVDEAVVAQFLAHPYFHKMPPKSLDRDSFAELQTAVAHLPDADAAATLAACAASAVARGAEHFPSPVSAFYVCGGGRHNAAIMAGLRARLGLPVEPVESIGLNGDMLEAQAFAYLAVRVLRGLPTSGPSTTGVAALVGGGQVSG